MFNMVQGDTNNTVFPLCSILFCSVASRTSRSYVICFSRYFCLIFILFFFADENDWLGDLSENRDIGYVRLSTVSGKAQAVGIPIYDNPRTQTPYYEALCKRNSRYSYACR